MGVPEDDCNLLITSTDQDIRVLCGDYHCLVTQTAPLEDKSHLEAVQETVSTKTAFPDAPQRVQEATAQIQISVQKGVLPQEAIPPDLMEAAAELTAFCDTEEAQAAMALVRAITRFVLERRPATAVFWQTSRFLMKPELFLDLDSDETAGLIYLHAHFYGERDPATGQQLVGVTGSGSQALIGYAVTIRPCALPPDYLFSKIVDFVAFTLESGQIIRDTDVFGQDEAEKIQVLHHLPRRGGAPEIELKVVHNPEYGIVREEVPTIYKHYDADYRVTKETVAGIDEQALDPNDPVDAAILEQLKARTGSVRKRETTEEENEQAFRDLDPPLAPSVTAEEPEPEQEQEPETAPAEEQAAPAFSRRAVPPTPPPAKRVSMEELRSLAQKAQASAESAEASRPKRGLLGKLFGRKSG